MNTWKCLGCMYRSTLTDEEGHKPCPLCGSKLEVEEKQVGKKWPSVHDLDHVFTVRKGRGF